MPSDACIDAASTAGLARFRENHARSADANRPAMTRNREPIEPSSGGNSAAHEITKIGIATPDVEAYRFQPMNITKLILAGIFALVTATGYAETCCEKAKAAGKDCEHKCCVKAKADGKVCEKCNPKK
jgi:hypothetical protein